MLTERLFGQGGQPDTAEGAALSVEEKAHFHLQRIRQCLDLALRHHAHGHVRGATGHLLRLYEHARDLLPLAGKIGRWACAEVASSVCFLLDRIVRLDNRVFDALEAHVVLLEQAVLRAAAGQSGISGMTATELITRLADLRVAAGVRAEHPHPVAARPKI